MSIADEEDVLDYPCTCSLVVVIDNVLTLDLDIKALIFEILSDHYNLLLPSKFSSLVCLSAKVVILFFSEY